MIFSPNKWWRKIFFPLLFKALWSRINSCYTIFKSETKKNATLLLLELSTVIWVSYIMRLPIQIWKKQKTKQGTQRMILFILRSLPTSYVPVYTLTHHQGIANIIWFVFGIIFSFRIRWKMRKLRITLPLPAFCLKTLT